MAALLIRECGICNSKSQKIIPSNWKQQLPGLKDNAEIARNRHFTKKKETADRRFFFEK
jgi:hypothetical protein